MKCYVTLSLLTLASCSPGLGPVVPKTRVERQMIGLLQKFDRWDVDGNGELKASELKEAGEISGRSPKKIVEFYDTDRSKTISLSEAQAGFSRADEVSR